MGVHRSLKSEDSWVVREKMRPGDGVRAVSLKRDKSGRSKLPGFHRSRVLNLSNHQPFARGVTSAG